MYSGLHFSWTDSLVLPQGIISLVVLVQLSANRECRSHPIISSKNVQRRLPCDGYRWELDQCVETSFFKIPDQTQDADAEQNINQDDVFPMAYSDSEADDDIGGLAYTIEATESLFLVSKFHDRHTLELSSSSQLSNWLHKFRQLDSRLLQ